MLHALVVALCALFLFVGPAEAGALFRGYCYVNSTDAANAWCAEARLPHAVGGIETADKVSGGNSQYLKTLRFAGVVSPYCAVSSAAGNNVSFTLNTPITGTQANLAFTIFQYEAGITGATNPYATSATSGTLAVAGSLSSSLTFPTCDPAVTDAENVAAIVALWPYSLGLIAVAWGLGFVRRRVIRWNESGGAA